jgi:translation initiation factor 3 subunit C
MSKFFAKKEDGSSSSEEESSEEEKVVAKKVGAKKKVFGDSSDEQEEEQRVVVSTADKRTLNLKDIFEKTKNHIKICDFVTLENDFTEIQNELEKCIGSVFATDKFQTLPPWVLKNLMALDDCVQEVTNE